MLIRNRYRSPTLLPFMCVAPQKNKNIVVFSFYYQGDMVKLFDHYPFIIISMQVPSFSLSNKRNTRS